MLGSLVIIIGVLAGAGLLVTGAGKLIDSASESYYEDKEDRGD